MIHNPGYQKYYFRDNSMVPVEEIKDHHSEAQFTPFNLHYYMTSTPRIFTNHNLHQSEIRKISLTRVDIWTGGEDTLNDDLRTMIINFSSSSFPKDQTVTGLDGLDGHYSGDPGQYVANGTLIVLPYDPDDNLTRFYHEFQRPVLIAYSKDGLIDLNKVEVDLRRRDGTPYLMGTVELFFEVESFIHK